MQFRQQLVQDNWRLYQTGGDIPDVLALAQLIEDGVTASMQFRQQLVQDNWRLYQTGGDIPDVNAYFNQMREARETEAVENARRRVIATEAAAFKDAQERALIDKRISSSAAVNARAEAEKK